MNPEQLLQKINQLENKLKELEAKFTKHQHDGIDGTNELRKALNIDVDQINAIGLSNHGSSLFYTGSSGDQYQYSVSVGEGYRNKNLVNKSNDMQTTFIHSPNTDFSFFTSIRKPIVAPYEDTSISVTSGGNTVTIAGYNFSTDELAGAIINIYNSSGTFIECQTIASNTATVVTISGTWGASTSSATFLIYKPVFMGSTDRIFNRAYVQEGTTVGGVRFGVGPTWTSGTAQNGLLYMDATGDLYWRNKGGTSTKLN